MLIVSQCGMDLSGSPTIPDLNVQEQDNHVLIDGSPSDHLIFSQFFIVPVESGPLSFKEDYCGF